MENMMRKALKSSEKRNKKFLKELVIVSCLSGINVTDSSRTKYLVKIVNILLLISSCCGIYGQYCYVYRHIDESFTTYIETICVSFQGIMSIIKMVYCLFRDRKLYYLLHTAESGKIVGQMEIFDMDIPTSIKLQIYEDIMEILRQSWLLIRRQLVFYISAVIMICSIYSFGGIVMNTYHRVIGTANYTLQTPNDSVFPMWESKGFAFPYFELHYIIDGSTNFISGSAALSFDGVLIVSTMHAMTLLRILHVIIRYSTHKSIEPHLRVSYLRHCIHHFERTYQYYSDVNAFYSVISLSQFVFSLLILGMVLFQANIGLQSDMKLFVTMVVYVIAAGFQMLIYCYNGQKLTTESEKLSFSWYDCDWYQESKEFKQLVKMMILRANRRMPMDVSGFTTMSLMTFVTVVQTSGSYFLLLKNVSQNEH